MPEMNGPDLVQALRAIYISVPSVNDLPFVPPKIICNTSDYTEENVKKCLSVGIEKVY